VVSVDGQVVTVDAALSHVGPSVEVGDGVAVVRVEYR
jgi:hypothetical protein